MLRARFNEEKVPQLIDELQVIADPDTGTPPDPRARLPNGSLSFTVWIKDLNGQILYRTHCYICPHSLLLGTGFLDPKAVFEPAEILVADRSHSDNDTCVSCGMWRPRAQAALHALAAYSKRCDRCRGTIIGNLKEGAGHVDELIRKAVAGRNIVAFRYNGQRRIGEPHLYGKTNGRATVLVFQTGGSSMHGPYPRWRRCDLDGITRFTVTGQTFQSARLGPESNLSDWDEIWEIVR